jgi:uncharacterized membrane protein YedE/YeeE
MLRGASTLLAGTIFGVGLAISEMINPAKVLAFLDIAGRWDPSLALVMAGALAVTAVGFRIVLKRPAPWFALRFELPSGGQIDGRLLAGAAVFGIGWGLVGFCLGLSYCVACVRESGVIDIRRGHARRSGPVPGGQRQGRIRHVVLQADLSGA